MYTWHYQWRENRKKERNRVEGKYKFSFKNAEFKVFVKHLGRDIWRAEENASYLILAQEAQKCSLKRPSVECRVLTTYSHGKRHNYKGRECRIRGGNEQKMEPLKILMKAEGKKLLIESGFT